MCKIIYGLKVVKSLKFFLVFRELIYWRYDFKCKDLVYE